MPKISINAILFITTLVCQRMTSAYLRMGLIIVRKKTGDANDLMYTQIRHYHLNEMNSRKFLKFH